MSVLAYHTTSPRFARLIAAGGFRVPARASHSRTDAPGMGGTFFRAVFVTPRKPTATRAYGPALITLRLSGKLIPYQARPGEGMVAAMQRHIRMAKRLGAAGVDMSPGWPDYGIMVVDPRAIRILKVQTRAFASRGYLWADRAS